MPVDQSTEGEARRASTLQKLQRARDMIMSAREDFSMLEGQGYQKNYDDLLKPYDAIGHHMARIRALKPPTGIFRI